jgi:lauroyl/myristoyl acyltransferase
LGLAILALKTGSDVYVAFDHRVGKYKHKTVVNGPINFAKTDNFKNDVKNLTQGHYIYFRTTYKTLPPPVGLVS